MPVFTKSFTAVDHKSCIVLDFFESTRRVSVTSVRDLSVL